MKKREFTSMEEWRRLYEGTFEQDWYNEDKVSTMVVFDSHIPGHTQKALEHYLIRGIMPGGFLEALLAADYSRAIDIADTANRERFWYIAKWIREHAPRASWGDYNVLTDWINDKGGCRYEYVNKVEKTFVWDKLAEKHDE